MKKLFITLLVLHLFSCSPNESKRSLLDFGGNEHWHLEPSDIILTPNDSLAYVFKSRAAINIPNLLLNKALKTDHYELYIAASQGLISERINAQLKTNASIDILQERITTLNSQKMYESISQKDSLFIYRAIFNKEKPSITMVICIVGNNHDRIFTIYNSPNFIVNKLK